MLSWRQHRPLENFTESWPFIFIPIIVLITPFSSAFTLASQAHWLALKQWLVFVEDSAREFVSIIELPATSLS